MFYLHYHLWVKCFWATILQYFLLTCYSFAQSYIELVLTQIISKCLLVLTSSPPNLPPSPAIKIGLELRQLGDQLYWTCSFLRAVTKEHKTLVNSSGT